MKYLMLCQVRSAAMAPLSREDMSQTVHAMQAYNQQMVQSGVLVAAGQLAPPETAQRVHTDNGHIKIQEGLPWAGGTQIGGYYLIDVLDEAEATGWAAKCPVAKWGSVDVRQVVYAPV